MSVAAMTEAIDRTKPAVMSLLECPDLTLLVRTMRVISAALDSKTVTRSQTALLITVAFRSTGTDGPASAVALRVSRYVAGSMGGFVQFTKDPDRSHRCRKLITNALGLGQHLSLVSLASTSPRRLITRDTALRTG